MTTRKTEAGNTPIWRRPITWIGLALLILLAALLRTAWISENAYITLTAVQNTVAGYGPVYNIGERVQVYTHPLWMIVLALLYAITRDGYYTVIIVQIIISLGVGVLIAREAKSTPAGVVGVLLLAASKAATDYGTSGLENPLSHLLFVAFIIMMLRPADEENRSQRLLWLSLLAALGALNRPDMMVIYLPALALLLYRHHEPNDLKMLALGMVPLALWGLFSLIYYGTPISNPALARLSAAMPLSALLGNSLLYFGHSLWLDPITLITVGLACVLTLIKPDPERRAIAAGILLYLAYTSWIGSDFMSGRFFSTPLVGAVLLLVTAEVAAFNAAAWAKLTDRDSTRGLKARLQHREMRTLFTRMVWAVVLLVIGFGAPRSALRTGSYYEDSRSYGSVADERGAYYACSGLFSATRLLPDPEARLARYGITRAEDLADHCGLFDSTLALVNAPTPIATFGNGLQLVDYGVPDSVVAGEQVEVALAWRSDVIIAANIGFVGYYLPPGTTLIDPYALNDAFLARLPADPGSRSGHFVRLLPPGYIDTRLYGVNLIDSGSLSAYYDTLETITTGPLFREDRIGAIIALNTGQLDTLVQPWRAWLAAAAENGDIYQHWQQQGSSVAVPDPATLQPTSGTVNVILLDPDGEVAAIISLPPNWTLPLQWEPGSMTEQGVGMPTPNLPGTYTVALEVSVTRGENTISLPVDGDPGVTRYILGTVEVLADE